MRIPDPIEAEVIPELCARVEGILREREADLVLCDPGNGASPTAATADALARLRLVARRQGRRFRVLGPCDALRDLLALMGLEEVLLLEPEGEAEQREERGGVEEEGDAADPIP